MNFGQAIEALKDGKRVARAGWNGKGMYLFIQRGEMAPVWFDNLGKSWNGVPGSLFDRTEAGTSVVMPHIVMKAADHSHVPGWLASQTDMLAEDWEIAS